MDGHGGAWKHGDHSDWQNMDQWTDEDWANKRQSIETEWETQLTDEQWAQKKEWMKSMHKKHMEGGGDWKHDGQDWMAKKKEHMKEMLGDQFSEEIWNSKTQKWGGGKFN